MKLKTTVLAIGAALAVLSGCSDSTQTDQEALAQATSKLAVDQLNMDKQVLSSTLNQLKTQDPSIIDAYFKLDDKGKKTVVVARQDQNGEIHTWEAPADELGASMSQEKTSEAAPAQSPDGGSSLLTGMLTGYLLSNMFSSAGASSAMSARQYDDAKMNAGRAYSSSVVSSARDTIRARAGLGRQSSLGKSNRGSFSSTGARAGGYASGG